VSSPRTWG